jgi:hypothetical protein
VPELTTALHKAGTLQLKGRANVLTSFCSVMGYNSNIIFDFTYFRFMGIYVLTCLVQTQLLQPEKSIIFTVVLSILLLSKSFIYQLMHNRVALKEY